MPSGADNTFERREFWVPTQKHFRTGRICDQNCCVAWPLNNWPNIDRNAGDAFNGAAKWMAAAMLYCWITCFRAWRSERSASARGPHLTTQRWPYDRLS